MSLVLKKVFAALRAEGVTKAAVAHDLKINVDDLDAVIFGLVVTALPGGGGNGDMRTGGPPIRLVK